MIWMMVQCVPSNKAADVTKLGEAADTPEVCATIQRDLEKLEKWADRNLVNFDKSKCKVLHLGRNKTIYEYMLWSLC